ncbi:LysR substrate-binding domain-containing protein [Devosia sp. 2618]|uniref:LysR substrate-binding domain-containing protein n=1 Tax=Devosia sp. 2618 TaxID=3156454 RepID=UPI003394EBD7
MELPRRALTPADIKQLLILTDPSPSPTYSILMGWFAAHGLVPLKVSTCSSLSLIKNVVTAGTGIGVYRGECFWQYSTTLMSGI